MAAGNDNTTFDLTRDYPTPPVGAVQGLDNLVKALGTDGHSALVNGATAVNPAVPATYAPSQPLRCLVFALPNTGATALYDVLNQEKIEINDVDIYKIGAGAGNTVQIRTAAGVAISDAIVAAVDKALTRAGQIDMSTPTNVIAAGAGFQINNVWAAGSNQCVVCIYYYRR